MLLGCEEKTYLIVEWKRGGWRRTWTCFMYLWRMLSLLFQCFWWMWFSSCHVTFELLSCLWPSTLCHVKMRAVSSTTTTFIASRSSPEFVHMYMTITFCLAWHVGYCYYLPLIRSVSFHDSIFFLSTYWCWKSLDCNEDIVSGSTLLFSGFNASTMATTSPMNCNENFTGAVSICLVYLAWTPAPPSFDTFTITTTSLVFESHSPWLSSPLLTFPRVQTRAGGGIFGQQCHSHPTSQMLITTNKSLRFSVNFILFYFRLKLIDTVRLNWVHCDAYHLSIMLTSRDFAQLSSRFMPSLCSDQLHQPDPRVFLI